DASPVDPALALDRDGAVRAIAWNTKVWLWDPAQRHFHGDGLPHPEGVEYLALSRDGRLLATAGPGEPAVQLWGKAGENRSVRSLLHQGNVDALAFGPLGSD